MRPDLVVVLAPLFDGDLGFNAVPKPLQAQVLHRGTHPIQDTQVSNEMLLQFLLEVSFKRYRCLILIIKVHKGGQAPGDHHFILVGFLGYNKG